MADGFPSITRTVCSKIRNAIVLQLFSGNKQEKVRGVILKALRI
jgi:hypothetical protein